MIAAVRGCSTTWLQDVAGGVQLRCVPGAVHRACTCALCLKAAVAAHAASTQKEIGGDCRGKGGTDRLKDAQQRPGELQVLADLHLNRCTLNLGVTHDGREIVTPDAEVPTSIMPGGGPHLDHAVRQQGARSVVAGLARIDVVQPASRAA
jgi:hypothetical protein